MSRTMESDYYKTDDKTIPVRWCAPEVIDYGRFSSQSGMLAYPCLLLFLCMNGLFHCFRCLVIRGCVVGNVQLWKGKVVLL